MKEKENICSLSCCPCYAGMGWFSPKLHFCSSSMDSL